MKPLLLFNSYRDLVLPYRAVAALAAIAGIAGLSMIIAELLAPGTAPEFANRDFANYWIAGKLILGGETADLFGPQPQYFRHLTDAFGRDYPWHNWSYPPHYLLFLWPLGWLATRAHWSCFSAQPCSSSAGRLAALPVTPG
jgi:hypothetical protein